MDFSRNKIFKSLKIIQLSLLLGIVIFSSKTSTAEDYEVWTFTGVGTSFKNMDLSLHSANFFAQEGVYFLNHTQLSLDFLSKKSFSVGLGYKQEYVKFPDYWRTEYRPMLHLYYTKMLGFIELRDRSRWEFRFVEGELIHRYRNQIQFSYKKFKRIIPYLSTEFSFYLDGLGYSRQRTVMGSIIPINSVIMNLFLGYQVNEDLPQIWTNKYMLGTSLRYSF